MSQLEGVCSICDAEVNAEQSVEVSEVLICPDCKSRLVVSSVQGTHLYLEEAPEVEEDWGE